MARHFIATLKHFSLLRFTLFSAPLLDEITSAFLAIALPLASTQLHLDYTQVGLLFTIAALVAMLLDPFINLLSDQHSKRFWILGGLLISGLSFALAATTYNFALLACSFALLYVGVSCGTGLAEAALIDQNPQESTQTMTRWTIMASIGDLLGPLVVSIMIIRPNGWSILCWIGCILWLGMACIIAPQRFPQPIQSNEDEEDKPSNGRLARLREALRDPALVRWAILSLLPNMLDEIFIVYATFYLRDVLHIQVALIGLLLALHMIGAFIGLFVLDRVLLQRITSERLLTWLALLVIASMVGFLTLRSVWCAGLMLFLIGLGVAGLYPLAQAEAYKRFPGRAGMVRAVISLGAPFDVALPYIAGFVAGRFGVVASLCFLGTAPLLMLLLKPRRAS